LALIIRTTLFIGAVEDVKTAVIDVFASNDIGNEFQDRGLSNASLSNKKDSDCLILCNLDVPFLERLYVARKYG
jgi:hypothetical protein